MCQINYDNELLADVLLLNNKKKIFKLFLNYLILIYKFCKKNKLWSFFHALSSSKVLWKKKKKI